MCVQLILWGVCGVSRALKCHWPGLGLRYLQSFECARVVTHHRSSSRRDQHSSTRAGSLDPSPAVVRAHASSIGVLCGRVARPSRADEDPIMRCFFKIWRIQGMRQRHCGLKSHRSHATAYPAGLWIPNPHEISCLLSNGHAP